VLLAFETVKRDSKASSKGLSERNKDSKEQTVVVVVVLEDVVVASYALDGRKQKEIRMGFELDLVKRVHSKQTVVVVVVVVLVVVLAVVRWELHWFHS